MQRTHGFREMRHFYGWLPEALHDAPGICWEDLPAEVMGYAVRILPTTSDAAPLAVAVAAANGQVQTDTQVKMLSVLAPLLCALRSAGMKQVSDLHQEALWRTFAASTERTGRRSKQLAVYSSISSRYIPAYLQRLSADERQRMQPYALPTLPAGFLKAHSGNAQMEDILIVALHCTEEQVNAKIANAKRQWLKRRWEIVRTALLNPRPVAEIAEEMEVSPAVAMNVLLSYNQGGARAIETQGRSGRHHSYLSQEEELTFVSPLLQRLAGEGLTIHQAKHAFEERVGREVNMTTVFRLFARYGVHKFTRSRHRSQQTR